MSEQEKEVNSASGHGEDNSGSNGDQTGRAGEAPTLLGAPATMQEGKEEWQNLSGPRVSSFSFSRRMIHTIDNARVSICHFYIDFFIIGMPYTQQNNIEVFDNNEKTYCDGFYFIPYAGRRASMRPKDVKYMMENYDFVRLKSIGFRIIYANSDQIEWHSTASTSLPTHTRPRDLNYWIWEDNTGFWTQKAEIVDTTLTDFEQGRIKLFDVNNELKTDKPRNWADRKLKMAQWRMSQKWASDVPGTVNNAPNIDNGIEPFDHRAFMKNYGVGTAGYSHTHEFNTPMVPTVQFDIDGRESKAFADWWNDSDYYWPDNLAYDEQIPLKREFTSAGREYPIHYGLVAEQRTHYCQPPLDKYIRLDRTEMRNLTSDVTGEIQIEYFSNWEGIKVKENFDWWDHRKRNPRNTLTHEPDIWSLPYRRTWGFNTNVPNGEMIAAYNVEFGVLTQDSGTDPNPPIDDQLAQFPLGPSFYDWNLVPDANKSHALVSDVMLDYLDALKVMLNTYANGVSLPANFLLNTSQSWTNMIAVLNAEIDTMRGYVQNDKTNDSIGGGVRHTPQGTANNLPWSSCYINGNEDGAPVTLPSQFPNFPLPLQELPTDAVGIQALRILFRANPTETAGKGKSVANMLPTLGPVKRPNTINPVTACSAVNVRHDEPFVIGNACEVVGPCLAIQRMHAFVSDPSFPSFEVSFSDPTDHAYYYRVFQTLVNDMFGVYESGGTINPPAQKLPTVFKRPFVYWKLARDGRLHRVNWAPHLSEMKWKCRKPMYRGVKRTARGAIKKRVHCMCQAPYKYLCQCAAFEIAM